MPAFDPIPVLVVEDSEDDLFFFRRLIAKAGLALSVAVAVDGQEAINQLSAAATPPRLIFLDLKLPLRSGFEVLQWIRAQPALARTAVVVLSSSAEARDVAQAFAFGAQGYLVKYPAAADLHEILQRVSEFPPGANVATLTLPGLPRP